MSICTIHWHRLHPAIFSSVPASDSFGSNNARACLLASRIENKMVVPLSYTKRHVVANPCSVPHVIGSIWSIFFTWISERNSMWWQVSSWQISWPKGWNSWSNVAQRAWTDGEMSVDVDFTFYLKSTVMAVRGTPLWRTLPKKHGCTIEGFNESLLVSLHLAPFGRSRYAYINIYIYTIDIVNIWWSKYHMIFNHVPQKCTISTLFLGVSQN